MCVCLLYLFLFAVTCHAKYVPTWESIDSRPLPGWYDSGKIGIFLHWGVFSAPSYNGAWFWYTWKHDKRKDIVNYMGKNFKPDFTYADFAPMFTTEFFEPERWADIFQKAGARYVVLTSKHHEGFTNWPSKHSFSWNSMDVGPNRDLVGELAAAIRNKTDLKFGLYHSMFEFYNPLFLEDRKNNFTTNRFVRFKTMPELYELVNNYHPEVIWSDGDWMVNDTYWDSLSFLTWLYNESPVKDTVVVNDRWGSNTPCKHGGFFNCKDRFNPGKLQKKKWENAMTLDKHTWAFNRASTLTSILTMEELLKVMVETISCGGNLLLNVGPTHDGRIVPIFEERLLSMGEWLGVNGEAIYESKPWTTQNDTYNSDVWYTMKTKPVEAVYAITLKWPASGVLSLGAPVPIKATTSVELLGYNGQIPWSKRQEGGLDINIPVITFDKMPCKWAWVFKLTGLQNVDVPHIGDDELKFRPYY